MDEHLTPAGLTAALHVAMRDGEMPPAGPRSPPLPVVEQLAEGLAPVVGPDLVCVMVGAPGVTTTFDVSTACTAPGRTGARRSASSSS